MPSEGCRIQFAPQQIPRIRNIYESIHYELAYKKQGIEQVVHCLIKELLLLSSRKFHEGGNSEQLPVESGLPSEISYLVQYIGSHFHEEITLDKLSQLVHMNSTYLCSLFHKITGLTIGKFITVKRVHHAKKLLRDTRLPIAFIAQQSGFNDDSYFIRTFKKAEGITPAVYRRQFR
jgi:AraC-like DNA-binding protein